MEGWDEDGSQAVSVESVASYAPDALPSQPTCPRRLRTSTSTRTPHGLTAEQSPLMDAPNGGSCVSVNRRVENNYAPSVSNADIAIQVAQFSRNNLRLR